MSSTSYIISIRNALGVSVGQADSLTEDGVFFEMTHPITVGEVIEFRMELPRANETVLGDMRVVAGKGPPGSLVRYRAEIVRIEARDQDVYAGWLDRTRRGRPADDLRSRLDSLNSLSSMHGATAEETDNALRRIDERKQRMASIREQDRPKDDAPLFVPGLFEQQPVGTAPPVRSRREAPAPAAAPPPAAPPPAAPPPAPPAPPEAPPPHPEGPWVDLEHLRNGPVLAVAWPDRSRVLPGTATELERGRLRLPATALADWPSETAVHLVLPGGDEVTLTARLESVEEGQVCYLLQSDPAMRRRLVGALG